MPGSSDEYLAKLGIDTSDVQSFFDQLTTTVAHGQQVFTDYVSQLTKVETALGKAASAAQSSATGQKSADDQAAKGTVEWQAYTKALNDANAAYRDAQRGNVGGTTNASAGVPTDPTSRNTLLQTSAAQSANVITQIKAEEKATNDAVASSIAAYQKQTDAFVESYQKQYQAAVEFDAKIAADQQSKRYAGGEGTADSPFTNIASGNTFANTGTTAANRSSAQAGYSNDELSEMNAYYASLEQTTAATDKATKSTQGYDTELPRLRYALYDVSYASAIAGAALLAGGVAAEKTSVQYDALFANVARTATGLNSIQLGNLKNQLIDLSTQVPLSFDTITQIATLGNQLNIPANQLVAFTKTTAEFAATTNVSTDTAATAFGRLSQILKDDDFKGLGDDIAYLGVKSVATETQIIAIAQGIGVTTTAAGYAAGQTLALSSAMASVGTAPEAARGTILRVFNDINKAIQTPGATLNEFAAVTGQTAQQFSKSWGTDAAGTFTKFVEGLKGSGDGVNSTLSALGITATRDQQALGLLANNSKVLTDANDDLTKSNGYLATSYGVIADTAQSKFTIAQNQVLAVLDKIGESASGPVVDALNIINGLLDTLSRTLDNPAAAGGAAIAVGLTAIGGAGLLAFGAVARLAATMAALRTAQDAAGKSGSVLGEIIGLLNPFSVRAAAGQDELTASTERLGLAQQSTATKTSAAMSEEALATDASSAAQGAAQTAAGGLSGALGKAGLIGAALSLALAMPAVIDTLTQFQLKSEGLSADVDTLTNSIVGLTTASTKTNSLASLTKLLVQPAVNYSYNGDIVKGVPSAGKGLVGGSLTGAQAYYNTTKSGSPTNGQDVFDGSGAINNAEKLASANIQNYDAAIAKLVSGGNLKAAQAGISQFDSAMEKNGLTQKQAESLLTQTNQALGGNASASKSAASAADDLSNSSAHGAAVLDNITNHIYGASNAALKVSGDLNSLGAAFVNNGSAAASTGPEIQQAISDIYAASSSGPEAASKMQTLFDALVKGGYASASQLAGLAAEIRDLNGGKNALPDASQNVDALATGFNNAAKAAASAGDNAAAAAPKVRTLADYASDLSSVFSRAQDIQFGPQEGLDKVTSDYNSIRDGITAANKTIQQSISDTKTKISDLDNTIRGLKSSNNIDEYFLGIAKSYGDTLRVGQITSEIADNNSQISDSQGQIATAQSDNATTISTAQATINKSLDGNSDAAIANRAQITGLISDYSDYITKLAGSGLSQDQLKAKTAQLKQEFIAQATQLGFTKSDVDNAATAFDDMTTAINGVPRDITVSVNTKNPGETALKEYIANLNSINGKTVTTNVKTNYSTPTGTPPSDDDNKRAAAQGYLADIAVRENIINNQNLTPTQFANELKSIQADQAAIKALGKYDVGGWTGNGPIGSAQGIVHAQEFVLNPVGAKMLPMSYLNALNQGIMPRFPAAASPVASINSAGTAPLELSPYDRQLLIDIRDRTGTTLGGNALQQANNTQNVDTTRRGSN